MKKLMLLVITVVVVLFVVEKINNYNYHKAVENIIHTQMLQCSMDDVEYCD